MNSLKGFTLIELFVVFAIIAVLVAILVPSLIGYVGESKLSTANANAKLVYSEAARYCIECDNESNVIVTGVNGYNLTWANNERPEFTYDGNHMGEYVSATIGNSGKIAGYFSVEVDSGIIMKSTWAKSLSDSYVGCYPVPAMDSGENLFLS